MEGRRAGLSISPACVNRSGLVSGRSDQSERLDNQSANIATPASGPGWLLLIQFVAALLFNAEVQRQTGPSPSGPLAFVGGIFTNEII